MSDTTVDVAALALCALDEDRLPAALGVHRLPLAWALKDLCYEAFSTAPPRAVRAASLLRQLARPSDDDLADQEVGALADWTAGIGNLTRGLMQEAMESLDDAAQGLTACGQADAAAQTQVPKIMALSMLGRHDDAIACAEAARAALLKLGNRRAAARVVQNLGSLHLRRDAYPQAARHFREAAVLFARLRDHEHSVLADIGLADALTSQGDFEEALRIYARARMRAGARQFELPCALVDESVALLDLARGRWREALAGLESVRRRYERLAMPQYLAVAEKQLADAYLELRLLPEAKALFSRAEQQFGGLSMPDEQAWALVQLGRAQALLGKAGADQTLAQAQGLFEVQDNAVGSASVALARAELALRQGDFSGAIDAARRAGSAFEQAGVVGGAARSGALQGFALLAKGERSSAQQCLTQTMVQATARQQWHVQALCLDGLGQCAEVQGDARLAAQHYEQSIQLLEIQRRALPGSELRGAFLADRMGPYEGQLRLALARGDASAALGALEQFRARTLTEQVRALVRRPSPESRQLTDAQEAGLTRNDPSEVAHRRARLNWLYRRVQRLEHANEPLGPLHDEMQGLEMRLLEDARRDRLVQRDAADPLHAEVLNVARLQSCLEPGDALIEHGISGDELLACVVTSDAMHLVRNLATVDELAQALVAMRFQLDALASGAQAMHRQLERLTQRASLSLERLGRLLWSPLLPCLPSLRRVLIVPVGATAQVPFAALSVDGKSLGEQVQMAIVPSALAALTMLESSAGGGQRRVHSVAAFAEPSMLPFTAVEAAEVAALYPQGRALVGPEATVTALHDQAGRVDVLHLACHALFRQDNPHFSMLHLHDGAFSADEAQALSLHADTVVLSACETALSEVSQGDEMEGLVRSFLLAGARRVVASLWPVDDHVALQFMRVFHAALAAGQPAAVAMARAQESTRKSHPHPAYWGAFALYGAW